jgi:dihydrofolate reductase
MRKVILNLAVSLDGFIEGPNGEYDWCFTDQDYGMTDFIHQVDSIFFGRKSYQLLINTEPGAYRTKKKYVFSNTLRAISAGDILISGDIERQVRSIKEKQGKDIWLFGGASLTSTLIGAGLVDELQLSIHPLLLGSGKLLFRDLPQRIPLTLTASKTYSTGLVQLFYHLE